MSDRNRRRATRLALLYPRQWRRRYPDFVEVLADELADHPRGVRGDLVRSATVERLRAIGVPPGGPGDRVRSGLALMYASLLPFAGLSIGMWSQLRTGTAGRGTAYPVLRTSALLLALDTALAVAVLAGGVPLVAANTRRRRADTVRAPTSGPFLGPVLALAGALAVLTAGGWAADQSGWYSPAAAALPTDGFGHVLTLWARGMIAAITPAWVHPGLFGHMPTGDLLATLAAPVATVVASVALLRLMVRLLFPVPRQAHVAVAITAVGAMFLSTAATARWLLAGPHGEGSALVQVRQTQLAPGHTPWAVAVALLALAVTGAIGTQRVLRSGRRPPGRAAGRRWMPAARDARCRPTASGSIAPITAER